MLQMRGGEWGRRGESAAEVGGNEHSKCVQAAAMVVQ